MKKELKDYLHLYLGCECLFNPFSQDDKDAWVAKMNTNDLNRLGGRLDWMKPILRPLSSITGIEAIELIALRSDVYLFVKHIGNFYNGFDFEFEYESSRRRRKECQKWTELSANQFTYLLKKGFDLFGLIDAGLALDKTKL